MLYVFQYCAFFLLMSVCALHAPSPSQSPRPTLTKHGIFFFVLFCVFSTKPKKKKTKSIRWLCSFVRLIDFFFFLWSQNWKFAFVLVNLCVFFAPPCGHWDIKTTRTKKKPDARASCFVTFPSGWRHVIFFFLVCPGTLFQMRFLCDQLLLLLVLVASSRQFNVVLFWTVHLYYPKKVTIPWQQDCGFLDKRNFIISGTKKQDKVEKMKEWSQTENWRDLTFLFIIVGAIHFFFHLPPLNYNYHDYFPVMIDDGSSCVSFLKKKIIISDSVKHAIAVTLHFNWLNFIFHHVGIDIFFFLGGGEGNNYFGETIILFSGHHPFLQQSAPNGYRA